MRKRLPLIVSLLALACGGAALVLELTRDAGSLPPAEDLEFVSQYSEFDSVRAKEVVILCSRGKRLLHGGGSVGYPARMPTVATTRSVPFREHGRDGWWYAAREIRPLARKWEIFAVAVCVKQDS